MTDTLQYRFLCRRGTASALAAANEVPLQGEICKELDTGREKTGDGVTHFNDLPYTIPGASDVAGLAHGNALLWDAIRGLFVPGAVGGGIPGPGISIETDSEGNSTISAKLEEGEAVTLEETSDGGIRISSSGGSLGTAVSTPDATGTIVPPSDITDWIKMKIGAGTYLVPAFKYLGEAVITSLPTYIHNSLPVAYWQLQETSGTTLLDDVAGETMTLSGAYTLGSASLVAGDTRKSILFNGGFAAGTGAAKWALGSGDCAGIVVARWESSSLQTIFSIRDGSGTGILSLVFCNRVTPGDVSAENWDWSNHKANSPGVGYNNNAVHVVGFSLEASTRTLKLWVDGVMIKSVVCNPTRPVVATMLPRLASNAGIQNLVGNLQDFALWSRQLTAQEHQDIANIVFNGHT